MINLNTSNELLTELLKSLVTPFLPEEKDYVRTFIVVGSQFSRAYLRILSSFKTSSSYTVTREGDVLTITFPLNETQNFIVNFHDIDYKGGGLSKYVKGIKYTDAIISVNPEQFKTVNKYLSKKIEALRSGKLQPLLLVDKYSPHG